MGQIQMIVLITFLNLSHFAFGQVSVIGKMPDLAFQSLPNSNKRLVKNQFSNQAKALADNIHCMMEDRAGNLWFGTTGDGVYQYDGQHFVNFTSKQGLVSNAIWSLLEDQKGNIWMGTDAGLCMFDGKSISSVPLEGSFGFTTNEYGSSKNAIWSMLLDSKGKIWLGTGEAVFCYDGKSITSVKPNGDGWIRYFVPDKKGWIWFGGRLKGNFYFDGKAFANFNLRTDIGNVMLCDAAGNLWFCGNEGDKSYESKDGIWRYDGKGFVNFSINEGLGKEFVHSMLQDRRGNIWIGTRNTGLYRYDGKKITRFSE